MTTTEFIVNSVPAEEYLLPNLLQRNLKTQAGRYGLPLTSPSGNSKHKPHEVASTPRPIWPLQS